MAFQNHRASDNSNVRRTQASHGRHSRANVQNTRTQDQSQNRSRTRTSRNAAPQNSSQYSRGNANRYAQQAPQNAPGNVSQYTQQYASQNAPQGNAKSRPTSRKNSKKTSSRRTSKRERQYRQPGASAASYSDPTRYSASASRPDMFSRDAATQHYASEHKRLHRHRILKRVLITILIIVLAAVVAAAAYIYHINSNLNRGTDSGLSNVLVSSNMTKEPFYMVLMGTDQSLQRDEDGSTADTYRTDSIMLARLDPVNKKITLISLPRDTQVNLPEYGTQKLNAAYAFGGPSLAVQTVSNISGQSISHYGLVDMDGLKEVVDDLGGIDVNVPMTIDDEDAGGHLDAGEQTLNGDQALILCRSRHAYDQYGAGDDFRAANQRLVLAAIANKMLASDPLTIANTVNTLSQYVQTDLSVNDIIALAQTFQGMDVSNDMYSAEMPTNSVYEDDLWYEQIDQQAWQQMMQRVNNGEPPTTGNEVDAATGTILSNAGSESTGTSSSTSSKAGTVVVRNGSGAQGVAASVSSKLSDAGYSVGNAGNADSFNYTESLVVYDDVDDAGEAQDIANIVGGATAMQNDGNYLYQGDFLVIIGKDYSDN